MIDHLKLINEHIVNLLNYYEVGGYIRQEHDYSGLMDGRLWGLWVGLDIEESGYCERVVIGDNHNWFVNLDTKMRITGGIVGDSGEGVSILEADDVLLETVKKDIEKESTKTFGAKEGAVILGEGATPMDLMGGFHKESRGDIKKELYRLVVALCNRKDELRNGKIMARLPERVKKELGDLDHSSPDIGLMFMKLDHANRYAEVCNFESEEINKITNVAAKWWTTQRWAISLISFTGYLDEKLIVMNIT